MIFVTFGESDENRHFPLLFPSEKKARKNTRQNWRGISVRFMMIL